MSQEGYKSSSFSESKDKFDLSPYMIEAERTPAKVEKFLKELEIQQNSPQNDLTFRNTRIGNKNWCICSKTCGAIVIEMERLCCKGGNKMDLDGFLCYIT